MRLEFLWCKMSMHNIWIDSACKKKKNVADQNTVFKT